MYQLIIIWVFIQKVINLLIFIFDTITGISELKKGRIFTFIQVTRSKNLFMIPIFLISGRNKGDCLYLSIVSFIIPVYLNGGTTDFDFFISSVVFFELYIQYKIEEGLILKLFSWFIRFLIIYNFKNEKTSYKFLSSPIQG